MSATEIVHTTCAHDCGGRCVLKVHVAQDRILRIETDDGEEPQLRACLRGRAYRQRVYSHDRLKYPMKRTGARGEGKFERVSWDEALDTVAEQLLRVKRTHGNSSILFLGGAGSQSALQGRVPVERMLALFGGYTGTWGSASLEGPLFASLATYGTTLTGNSWEDLLNSRLIIMWGWNPAATVWVTNTPYTLAKAKEKGIRIISIDPRLTESTAVFASEWVPIRPGTDAAMLIAMAYVMIRDELQDQKFLDSNTVGFDVFKDYVLGIEDGVPKTPSWAEAITGVPGPVIERLAVEYATTSPAALIPGWAPARGARGEQFSRVANTVIAMTGNIGVPGGFAGGLMRPDDGMKMESPGTARNAVDRDASPRRESLFGIEGASNVESTRIHGTKIYDAILRGKSGGYPSDPKLAYIVARNVLNTHLNFNEGITALQSLEFIVVQEQRMTPTARYADILFPVSTFMERDDVIQPWLRAPYCFFMNQAITPMFESRSDREICAQLTPRLGIPDFGEGRTDEEWLKAMVEDAGDVQNAAQFKRDGMVRVATEQPFIAFRPQVEDPVRHPFPTPSGKIEIYSERLAEMNNAEIPPVPRYLPSPEGYEDPIRGKYPLQLLSAHHFSGTHTTMEKIPWLDEAGPRRLWINACDAERRGILNGDSVLVFNDRGKVLVRAKVTERISPGVVNLPHGGWSAIDENRVDRGGCANVLTASEHSPGGAWSVNTARVEVTKSGGTAKCS